jgi:ABC-type nitrate/sulfonate/bicarbonate transport system substrate-binding protein
MTKRLPLALLCASLTVAALPPAGGAQARLDTVSFGILAWSPLFYVPMVGVEKGIFEKHGVKLDVVFTQGSGPAIQAVLGGSMNMAATTSGSAFLAQMQAPDLKQIVGVVERSPYTLVVRPEIKSIADLKGKVLGGSGVRAGADTETMRLMFKAAGLQESDYTVIAAGSSTIRSQSLVKGTISGLAQFEPYVTMLRDEGMVPLARAIDFPATRNLHLIIMVAMRSWYTQNEAAVSKFFRAWAESHAWLHDPKNKDEAIRIYAARMKQSERHATATYRSFVEEIKAFSPRGQMNLESVRQYGEAMRFLGHPIPADVDGFADLTPARKAFGN